MGTAQALGEAGEWRVAFALGAGMLEILAEMAKRELVPEEMKPVAALAEGVCGVIAGAAALRLGQGDAAERAQVLTLARAIDEATGGRWGLEAWVERAG